MSTLNQIKVGGIIYDLEDTQARQELLNKINKVEGKDLSTNDFTNEDKAKLNSLLNYDDAEIRQELNNKQNNLVSGQNIKTINGQDILGEGNIEIQGGSGGSSGYKLLNKMTLTEETRVLTFTQDLDGKPFECDEILILLTTVPMANATDKCSIQYNINDSGSGHTVTTNNSLWTGTTRITNSCHIIKPYSSSNIRISAIRMGEPQSGQNFGNYDGQMTENSYINKIQVYVPPSHNHTFGIGTDIEIYGR